MLNRVKMIDIAKGLSLCVTAKKGSSPALKNPTCDIMIDANENKLILFEAEDHSF